MTQELRSFYKYACSIIVFLIIKLENSIVTEWLYFYKITFYRQEYLYCKQRKERCFQGTIPIKGKTLVRIGHSPLCRCRNSALPYRAPQHVLAIVFLGTLNSSGTTSHPVLSHSCWTFPLMPNLLLAKELLSCVWDLSEFINGS